MSPEFTLLARQNNVIPFSFLSHLTHCMQPLDVGIFQPYKHWHNKAVQSATESLDFEYSISSFFKDLKSIRQNTFKKSTILNAWKKAGMWPVSRKAVLKLMDKYSKLEQKKEVMKELELLKSGIPKTVRQVQYQLDGWKSKVMDILSSPSRREFESFKRGTQAVLYKGEFVRFEKDNTYIRLAEVMTKKLTNRKRV